MKLVKKLIPDTLLARLLLILIVPVIITQLITTYIFYERHWNNVSEKMVNYVAGEIAIIINAIENNIIQDPTKILHLISKSTGLNLSYHPQQSLLAPQTKLYGELAYLYEIITSKINYPIIISYFNKAQDVEVKVQLNQAILNIIIPNKRFSNPTTYIFILWMIGVSCVLTLIAIIFCRNQLRSITKLAIAAEKFGKGIKIEYFKPEGAKEVRKAGVAFIQMKKRIERQITQRTEMLAGVSHDLRTPLTRIKLQLAMLEQNDEIQGLNQDLHEMEYMIKSYLDFASGEGTEKTNDIMVTELINQVVISYNNYDINIELDIAPYINDIILYLRINAIKRCLTNFINNSIKYAKNIKIRVMTNEIDLIIVIEDDGPGISFEDREKVFKPFYRLDSSRNFDTGGVGLGLAIARDIITSHGGNIKLDSSVDLGGLKVLIYLPL